MSKPAIFRLKCAVQNYDWGKVGIESKVAQFAQISRDFEIQLDRPYSEVNKLLPKKNFFFPINLIKI